MENNKLIVRDMTLDDTLKLGQVLAKSGYFTDAREASQAVVKILAGRELGIEPIAAMSGISIVKGKPTLGANLIAALVRRGGTYDYRVDQLDEQECRITFYRKGAPDNVLGMSQFTMKDAEQAGLGKGDNWKYYPRNMLFARAMSNGARWYCPDVFAGQTPYTPEELTESSFVEQTIDYETGEIVDMETAAEPAKPTTKPKAEKPATNGDLVPDEMLFVLIDVLDRSKINEEQFKQFLVEKGCLEVDRSGVHLKNLSRKNAMKFIEKWDQVHEKFVIWQSGQDFDDEGDSEEEGENHDSESVE